MQRSDNVENDVCKLPTLYKTCSGPGIWERDRNHHHRDQSLVVSLVTMSVLCVTRDIVTERRVMLFVVTGVMTEDPQLEVTGTGCVM